MEWKGKTLETAGEIMDAVCLILKEDNPEEKAQEFMNIYRSENQYADENIGYMSGYYSAETMKRIQEVFVVRHPIFGNFIPSAEEAFEAGKNL